MAAMDRIRPRPRIKKINLFAPQYVSHWSFWTISELSDAQTAACHRVDLCLLVPYVPLAISAPSKLTSAPLLESVPLRQERWWNAPSQLLEAAAQARATGLTAAR